MMEKKKKLSNDDIFAVTWRHQFLQGSWNYERMQNGGWCYSIIPAIKKLYTSKEDRAAALKRHMEFYNTHPYVSAPIMGVTLALEEDRANGADVTDETIQGVKVGMMGPLAGVGDPVFWFTLRPIIGALGASFAMDGNILGPILFFVLWNVIRFAFLFYTTYFGYKVGTEITKDLSGGLLGKITQGASILGMFVVGALVDRWVSIKFALNVSRVKQQDEAFINWAAVAKTKGGATKDVLKEAFKQYNEKGGLGIDKFKVTTLQDNLDQLIPGFAALILTLICCKLLKKNVSPIAIIILLFVVGVVGKYFGVF